MGKADVSIKQWLEDRARFADLFNGVIFGGEEVIKSDELESSGTESSIIIADKDKKDNLVHRYRDIVKRWRGSINLVILAVESQDKVNYAMPVRNMVYDGLSYTDQIKEIWSNLDKDEKKKMTIEEIFSRFRKDDKLVPVITVVLYTGTNKWDGALTLHEMFEVEDSDKVRAVLDKYVPNYKVNLVDIMNMEDTTRFRSDLHIVFDMLKYREDKEKMRAYTEENIEDLSNVDIETANVMKYLLKAGKILEKAMNNNRTMNKDGRESVDMCKALEEWYEDGVVEGEAISVIKLVKKKVEKGKSVDVIAYELEETPEEVQKICDVIEESGAECSIEEIYKKLYE